MEAMVNSGTREDKGGDGTLRSHISTNWGGNYGCVASKYSQRREDGVREVGIVPVPSCRRRRPPESGLPSLTSDLAVFHSISAGREASGCGESCLNLSGNDDISRLIVAFLL